MPAQDAEIKAAISLLLGSWDKAGMKGEKIEFQLVCESLSASGLIRRCVKRNKHRLFVQSIGQMPREVLGWAPCRGSSSVGTTSAVEALA